MEEYVEVPSDSGITFNVKPKMKDLEIAEKVRVNLPNSDVVRHTGDIEATVVACKVADEAVKVSRSIRDVYLKKPEFSKDPLFQRYVGPISLKRPVMTAEPSIQIRKLRPHDLFMIFASDGLWEQLSDEATVDIIFKHPRSGIAKRLVRAAINEATRKRAMRYDDIKKIEKGLRRHFHNDITVVVIYLDHHQKQSIFKGRTVDCTNAPVDIFLFYSDEPEAPHHQLL